MSSRNSSKEASKPCRRGRPPKIAPKGKDKFVCNGCYKSFYYRNSLQSHVKRCEGNKKKSKNLKCMWCGVVFVNRGNLASHAFHIHGDSRYAFNFTQVHKIYLKNRILRKLSLSWTGQVAVVFFLNDRFLRLLHSWKSFQPCIAHDLGDGINTKLICAVSIRNH